MVEVENQISHTIDTARLTLEQKADLGSLDRLPKDARLSQWVNLVLNRNFYKEDLIMDKWEVPAGAFRGNIGGPM